MNMDIERLKEIRDFLGHSLFCLGRRNGKTIAIEVFRDIEKLIDEAITRQSVTSEEVAEAIAKIEKIVVFDNEHGYRVNNHHSLHISDIKTALVALQAYQPWIPVSERLPDGDMASVLIYTKEGGVAEGQYYPSIDSWKQFRWSVENSKVTHWKPLPEPPKGE